MEGKSIDKEIIAAKTPILPKRVPFHIIPGVTQMHSHRKRDPIATVAHSAQEATVELAAYADIVSSYVKAIREKGLDTNYILENAEMIKSVFFDVLDLKKLDTDGGEGGDTDGSNETKGNSSSKA